MSGYKTSNGTDLSSIFQARTDGVTTGGTLTGYKVNGVDLVYKYIARTTQTYSTTGFKVIGGADLNTLFQWGGYDATTGTYSYSSSFNSISITGVGSYFYVTVGGLTFYTSPFTYNASGLTAGTTYNFTLRPFNGFNVQGIGTIFSVSTISLSAPSVSITNITGVSSTSYNITFTYSGGSYATCSVRLYDSSAYTTFTTLGTISSISSTNTTFTTGTMTATPFYIKFVPLDSNGNAGTGSAGMSKTMNNSTHDYTTVQTNTSFTLQVFTYNVYYFLIGGGGSGGSGGGNGFSDCPDGGGGGGGGAGTVVGGSYLNLTGSSSQQGGVLTVGAGGSGVPGVGAGLNQAFYGNNGNNGGNSQLNFTNIIVYNASSGTGGFGGEGAHTHTTQKGGAGGSLGGATGGNDGGSGGAGGSTSYGYGNGSNGSKGETRNVTSATTSAAINGKVLFIQYYFV